MIDDVSLGGTTPSGTVNVLTPTVLSGAVFLGTVKVNGVTSTAATGTITFKTNGVTQSIGAVANGSFASLPGLLPSSYTVTAIYSGDATYVGSTSTLVICGSPFGTAPGKVTMGSGHATVMMSGIAGNIYSVQRATNVMFTLGVKEFPAATAPVGGQISIIDDWSDLGVVPQTAFYRLKYLP